MRESEVVVFDAFDDLKASQMRFLQEAAKLGPLHVLLPWDDVATALDGRVPKFPQEERQYFVEAIRYVDRLTQVDTMLGSDALPLELFDGAAIWAVDYANDTPAKKSFCDSHGLQYRVIGEEELQGYPQEQEERPQSPNGKKRVIVTGCYDWFHSGHVRFFEEAAELGDLYVVVGHDENIKLLKGEGHPMFSAEKRRYMAGSIRHVKQSLISSGNGWLDAEPQIERIKPDIYAVNQDGDRPEKHDYCRAHGVEYVVFERRPKEGLPKRESTDLRGF